MTTDVPEFEQLDGKRVRGVTWHGELACPNCRVTTASHTAYLDGDYQITTCVACGHQWDANQVGSSDEGES